MSCRGERASNEVASNNNLVQEDIIIDGCVKIPKQAGKITIEEKVMGEDTNRHSCILYVDLVLECIKTVDHYKYVSVPIIGLNLVDKMGVRRGFVMTNLDMLFLETEGNKASFRFVNFEAMTDMFGHIDLEAVVSENMWSAGNMFLTKEDCDKIANEVSVAVVDECTILKKNSFGVI